MCSMKFASAMFKTIWMMKDTNITSAMGGSAMIELFRRTLSFTKFLYDIARLFTTRWVQHKHVMVLFRYIACLPAITDLFFCCCCNRLGGFSAIVVFCFATLCFVRHWLLYIVLHIICRPPGNNALAPYLFIYLFVCLFGECGRPQYITMFSSMHHSGPRFPRAQGGRPLSRSACARPAGH